MCVCVCVCVCVSGKDAVERQLLLHIIYDPCCHRIHLQIKSAISLWKYYARIYILDIFPTKS